MRIVAALLCVHACVQQLDRGTQVEFLRPAQDEVTHTAATVIVEFVVRDPASSRIVFQIDGADQGVLCTEQHTSLTLNNLTPGQHTISVTVGDLPPAVLSFWHLTIAASNATNHMEERPSTPLTWTEARLDHMPISTPQRPLLTIKVLTLNRNSSLLRLLTSLRSANYDNDSVDLDIFVDYRTGGAFELSTMEVASTFSWPHGKKHVHRRVQNAGLVAQWLESWWPTSLNQFAFFAEVDMEV